MAVDNGGRREHRGPLMVKLSTEVERFRDRPFLKAAMAVSALAAQADGDVSLEERYRIDAILEREPVLAGFDTGKAISIFDEYIHALRSEPERSRRILMAKIERMATKPKRARTLMRVAWLIIAADNRVLPNEVRTFDDLCHALALEPDRVRSGVIGME